MRMFFLLMVLALLPACDAPGPLKADRDAEDLFGPSEDNVVVVDAVLIVDAPMPFVDLRRTVAPGLAYTAAATALEGAEVTITGGGAVVAYRPDAAVPGRYRPADDAPAVAPETDYALRVVVGGTEVRAVTRTPARLRVAELVLLDAEFETVVRRLKLFGEAGEGVFEAPENQLEHTVGFLEVRLENDAGAASYQFGIYNLEEASPLLFDSEFVEEEGDLGRDETSPPLRLEDGTLFLSWDGIFYAGRYKVKVFAVDRNWFDLVRTDNVGAERGAGEAGQGFQRPLFNIENGIGLFGAAAVDSIGFFVRPEGAPPCSGCQCWGCGDRASWSGILDVDTGTGRLRFERDVGTGAACELSFEISGAVPIEPCGACAFGWEFELGRLTVYRDDRACDEAIELEGERLRLAQGGEIVAEGGEAPRYGLFIDEGGWGQIASGWSVVLPTGAQRQWLFGFVDE